MSIAQQGALNTTALVVPDLYVQIVSPQNLVLNGVPTNVLGVVGTASWGPVNQATICSSMADYARQFGPIMARKYDAGTQVATAVQQGASNFRVVRVTDGTDTAASALATVITPTAYANTSQFAQTLLSSGGKIYMVTTGGTSTTPPTGTGSSISCGGGVLVAYVATGTTVPCLTFTSLYSGSQGNNIQVTIATGSAANTSKVIVGMPGLQPEVFDNIGIAPGSPVFPLLSNSFNAVANAINNGTALRGPSQFVAATVTAAANALSATMTVGSTYASGSNSTGTGGLSGMTGGTDGVTTITSSVLIGQDTIPRKGMYALRGQGASIALLADTDDTTQYTTQATYGLSEGTYMVLTGPSGDTISNAVTTKGTAGLDTYACKLMFGDWLYWNDQTNGSLRLVSPQGFAAGRLANLSPEQSSLNKPLYSIAGSQKAGQPGSAQMQAYSAAELQTLFQAGIDVISNPQPGGAYWGVRCGHNSSSNAATNGDNYTRMTNYIAATAAAGMGLYVGRVVNKTLLQRIRSTLLSFFGNMLQQGQLGTVDGSLPFGVICDITNNPPGRTGLGYVQADCQVQYQAINEKFIVNIEGGQTVIVTKQTVPSGQ